MTTTHTTTATQTSTARRRTGVAAVIGIAALTLAGLTASSATATSGTASSTLPQAGTSGPDIAFWTVGTPAPGAEIFVYGVCGENKNGKPVTSAEVSGAATTTLTGESAPDLDTGFVAGSITLPASYTGDPAALHLTCDNQATATTILIAGQEMSSATPLDAETTGFEDPATMADDDEAMFEDPATMADDEAMFEDPATMADDDEVEWCEQVTTDDPSLCEAGDEATLP